MRKVTLNHFYNTYLLGDIGRVDFESRVYSFLVMNQDKTCISGWEKATYDDFISWFYPRLKKSIDNYKETGASFEAFLKKYMFISAKEFQTKATTNSLTEYSVWSAQIPDMYAHEEAPAYLQDNAEEAIKKLITNRYGKKVTTRILALIIKCYHGISDDFAERIAPLIGISSKELIQMLDNIRKIRRERDDKIFLIKERTYCQFYRCIVYEKRLLHTREESVSYEKLKIRLERARIRLEKMRKRLSMVRADATNKQVAQVIGTTKGAVDSNLHRLRARWETMSKNADLN